MSIKIKVSYETPGELLLVKRELQALMDKKHAEVKHAEKGPYKRMYINIKDGKK